MITVVAALIKRNNKILIARRKTGDKNLVGTWEFPGGKVEQLESEQEALRREISEELGVDIAVGKFIINNIYEYPKITIDLRLYMCQYISGKFILHDHSEYKWVLVEELEDYDFAPADVLFIKYLKEKI